MADDAPTVARDGMSANGRSPDTVYFLQSRRRVKIGWSGDLPRRLRDHDRGRRRYNGEHEELVAVINGRRLDEETVHEYFHELKDEDSGPEVFWLAPQLIEYIHWLRSLDATRAFDDEDVRAAGGVVADVPVIDSSLWLPRPDRRLGFDGFGLFDLRQLYPGRPYPPREPPGRDFYAPPDFMEIARAALGGAVDLDPCSDPKGNSIVRARRYYSLAENGLVRPWYDAVWGNFPFDALTEWCAKAVEELDRGKITAMLVLFRTGALNNKGVRPLLERAQLLVLPLGRVDHIGPPASTAPVGHVLLGFAATAERLRAMEAAFPRPPFLVWRRDA